MQFDWAPAKNRANVQLHGIEFSDAVAIVAGPTAERLDDRQDYGEERWIALGLMGGSEIHIVYTDVLSDGEDVRWIISARRATRHEREEFYRSIGH